METDTETDAGTKTELEYVTSADGTRIAYERGGDGPPLVLVHGSTSDHASWDGVAPALRQRFTVFAMDRRGRGESGDAGPDEYAIEREFEDVVAVVSAIEGPANLIGHSYGALCSLGAAPSLPDLRGLVLYEPPMWTEGWTGPPEAALERMDELAGRGEYEAVLETFFRDVTRSEDRLEIYRSQPSWGMRVAAAPTVPREVRAIGSFRPDPHDYADVTTPTLVILGDETRAALTRSTRAAHDLLPDSELVVLEGEGHAAMYTAPNRFVEVVVGFLEDDARDWGTSTG